MYHGEEFYCPLLEELTGLGEMFGQIANKSFPAAIVQGVGPKVGDLTEVIFRITAHKSVNISGQGAAGLQPQSPGTFLRAAERVGEVVGGPILIVGHRHLSIPLEVPHINSVGAVHRDLHVVNAHAMTLRVPVSKETTLEHLIGRWLDPRNHVSRTEGQLLHLREVVGGIAIKDQFSDRQQGKILLGPHFGHVERVETTLFGLLVEHYLIIGFYRNWISFGRKNRYLKLLNCLSFYFQQKANVQRTKYKYIFL